MTPKGIGGFPSAGESLNSPGVYYFNSFRSSLKALLASAGVNKISIPVYYCHAVTEFIKDTGVDIRFYNIDESFYPINPDFADDRVLLYPNYFGVNGANVLSLLSTFDPSQIVIDAAQALTCEYDCLANINSYRKFLPVADGSLLISQSRVQASLPRNSSMVDVAHLLNENRSAAYRQFKAHEARFGVDDGSNGISIASLIGIGCTDFESIAANRYRHYNSCVREFERVNKLKFEVTDGSVPLCYPLLVEGAPTRANLVNEGIYVPSYWSMHSDLQYTPFEAALTSEALFLPLDQKLSSDEMSGMLSTVTRYLE